MLGDEYIGVHHLILSIFVYVWKFPLNIMWKCKLYAYNVTGTMLSTV